MKYNLLPFLSLIAGITSVGANAQGQALPAQVIRQNSVTSATMARPLCSVRMVDNFEAEQGLANTGVLSTAVSKTASANLVTKAVKASQTSLEANQVLMGNYRTDDVCADDEGLGFDNGTFKVASLISTSDAVKYNGGKIVAIRYALCNTTASNIKPFIYEVSGQGVIASDPVVSLTGTNNAGWNVISLPEPYEINIDRTNASGVAAFMIGIQCDFTAGTYPVGKYISLPYSDLYVYGSFDGSAEAWNDLGDSYGNLAVQCIVEIDGGLSTADLKLYEISAPRYVQLGGEANISFYCEPYSGTINSAKFGVRLGESGEDFMEINCPQAIEATSVFSQKIQIPADAAAAGESDALYVYVKEINGAEPDNDNLRLDDAVGQTVVTYTESLKRQKQLYEFYTSTAATYGTYGDQVREALMSLRDDIAPAGIHCNLSSGNDDFYLSASQNIMAYSVYGIPSASVNRYYYSDDVNSDGVLAFTAAYPKEYQSIVAQNFSTIIDASNADYPAFATVNIETSSEVTDTVTGKGNVTIKVSGDAVSNIDAVMGDAVLTVYLTRSNIRASQLEVGGSTNTGYRHYYVVSQILSAPLGDALTFDGGKYEMTYTATDVEKVKTYAAYYDVVAFISRPISYAYNESLSQYVFTTSVRDAWVTNCNSVNLAGKSTAVKAVDADADTVEARYSLDGRLLSSPVRGINIVRFKSGKAVKTIVR